MQGHHGSEKEVGIGQPAQGLRAGIAEEPYQPRHPEEDGQRFEIEDLHAKEGERSECDVLVFDSPVVKEFERGPVVRDLPDEIGGGDEDEDCDSDGGPSSEEKATLRCKEQAEERAKEEERHGGLVEQTDAPAMPNAIHDQRSL